MANSGSILMNKLSTMLSFLCSVTKGNDLLNIVKWMTDFFQNCDPNNMSGGLNRIQNIQKDTSTDTVKKTTVNG